jgi:hypothetical protein
MAVWPNVSQVLFVTLYLLIGVTVGNALACQVDSDRSPAAGRLLKAGACLLGLALWPFVLLYGAVLLIRALTDSGPF